MTGQRRNPSQKHHLTIKYVHHGTIEYKTCCQFIKLHRLYPMKIDNWGMRLNGPCKSHQIDAILASDIIASFHMLLVQLIDV